MTNNSDVRLFNNEARGRNTNMQRDYMREKKKKEKKNEDNYGDPHSTIIIYYQRECVSFISSTMNFIKVDFYTMHYLMSIRFI